MDRNTTLPAEKRILCLMLNQSLPQSVRQVARYLSRHIDHISQAVRKIQDWHFGKGASLYHIEGRQQGRSREGIQVEGRKFSLRQG